MYGAVLLRPELWPVFVYLLISVPLYVSFKKTYLREKYGYLETNVSGQDGESSVQPAAGHQASAGEQAVADRGWQWKRQSRMALPAAAVSERAPKLALPTRSQHACTRLTQSDRTARSIDAEVIEKHRARRSI
jgi:hypothetical protein